MKAVAVARWVALCFALLGASSCAGGTETGNPSFVAELSYAAYSSEPATVAVRAGQANVVVTKAWLVLGDVSFVKQGDCGASAPGSESEPHAPGLGVGDHAAGKVVTTPFDLHDGGYCAVDLPLITVSVDDLPSGAPSELVGHTLLIQGTLGAGTPFSIRSQLATSMRMSAEGGQFEMAEDMSQVLIGFDVAAWLKGVDLSTAEVGADGVEISSDHNAALLASFEKNLAAGVALFRDEDGDGKLDAQPDRLAQAH